MARVLLLRYPQPARASRPTKWAFDWRLRWFRNVGSVHQYHADNGLVACYSDDRDPAARLSLQRELEARPDGIAQVLAACRKIKRDFEASYA